MDIRIAWPLLAALLLATLAPAQQSGSPKRLGKDKLYEKSGGKGILVVNAGGINTPSLDFSPTWYQGGLVFISSRDKAGLLDEKTGEGFFRMYFTRLDPNGMPVKAEDFSAELNAQWHEGPVSFSRKGDVIYYTSNHHKKPAAGEAAARLRMKIYSANKGKDGWGNIRPLPFNSNEFSCMHPSLSRDGRKLYFSSDRPGGQGGNDIWVAEWDGNGWGEPTNLGPKVNTEGNEVFPFIHFSGTLFFSSDGQPDGLGGLDIYALSTADLPDATPQVLSMPFNSGNDDLGFLVDDSGTRGFFSSDRPGGQGKDDIYAFQTVQSLTGDADPLDVKLALQVIDESTGRPLSGTAIHVLPRDASGGIAGESVYDIRVTEDPAGGEDRLSLQLVRKQAVELGEPTLRSDDDGMALGEMRSGDSYLLLVHKPGFVHREIEYRAPAEPGAYDLAVYLKELDCHPVEGIARNQKTGEPLPKVTVEVELPGRSAPIRVETDSQGRFSCCLPGKDLFSLSGGKEGYIPGKTRVDTRDGDKSVRSAEILLLPFSNTPPEKKPEPLAEGSVIVLHDLLYDFNRYSLRPGSVAELDAMCDLMRRHPEMEIELGSHTDSRGPEDYNLRLSARRAESARNYLVSKGIAPARVQVKGYGESKLINRCAEGVSCTEEEHAANRRTEIRITKLDQSVEVRYGG